MSDEIAVLPQKVVDWLSSQENLSDITFLCEFPPVKKANPVKKPVVAVGIENITLNDHFDETEPGVFVENEYCRDARIKFEFGIHVPFSSGGTECHTVFTRIIDALTFNSDLNILESGCGETVSSRDTGAFVMTAYALVLADFCPAETIEENYHSFLDKELLCGSHIRNGDIHVTLDDKNYWNGIVKTGIYIGSGTGTRTLNLGFKPKVFMTGAYEVSPVTVDFTNKKVTSYWGFTLDNGYRTMGIETTSTGVKLLSGSSQDLFGATPNLNESGMTYAYFALR
ncbi:MAG: hypothetical protein IJM97_01505 [Clostridia bacterium]|nr:hypothetical protein [Clostridia bacterium]